MDKNVGPEDRGVRIVVAIGLALLIYFDVSGSRTADLVGAVIAAYLLISGLLSRCVFYKLIGVDTTTHEQSYSTTDDRSGL